MIGLTPNLQPDGIYILENGGIAGTIDQREQPYRERLIRFARHEAVALGHCGIKLMSGVLASAASTLARSGGPDLRAPIWSASAVVATASSMVSLAGTQRSYLRPLVAAESVGYFLIGYFSFALTAVGNE